MNGFAEFVFDLATPLFVQIRECLNSVEAAPLTQEAIDNGNDGPGVYILLLSGTPVYIGKAGDSVVSRLTKHRRTISGRKNISLDDMSFRTATFARTWNPFLPESHLIEHYGTKNHWNNKGFGGNEPGKRRYETGYKSDHFFQKYPINEMFSCEWLVAGEYDTADLCRALCKRLPFWVKLHEYSDIPPGSRTLIDSNHPSTIDVIRKVGEALGDGWRVAIIPSHVLIQYQPERSYPDMEIVYP